MATPFVFHVEESAWVDAPAQDVFEYLDDHRRLAAHMESASLMMAGMSMQIETDARGAQSVGGMIRLKGRVLGIPLFVEETVTQYLPHARKVWETVGEPRLLVIGRYRMGFEIEPLGIRARVRIWIDWDRPSQAATRWLSVLLGRFYARWCTGQMLRDCVRQFAPGRTDA